MTAVASPGLARRIIIAVVAATFAIGGAGTAAYTTSLRVDPVVFASNRAPELYTPHQFELRLNGNGRRQLPRTKGVHSPDGGFVAEVETGGSLSTVSVVAASGRAPVVIARFGDGGSAAGVVANVVWSPDSQRLAISVLATPYWDLWSARRDGSDLHHVAFHARLPAWSPDSRRLVFVGLLPHLGADGVSTATADGSDLHVLGAGRDPAWSPLGDLIAYHTRHATLVARPDGSAKRRLGTTTESSAPSWSHDGRRIAYVGVQHRPGPGHDLLRSGVEVAQVKTGRTTVVARSRLAVTLAVPVAWSPDDSRVAYVDSTQTRMQNGELVVAADEQVFAARVDGRGVRQVTHEPPWASFSDLRFSADGGHLVYTVTQNGGDGEIWTMNPDGSDLHPLTRDLIDELDPSVAPDGRQIVFVGRDAGVTPLKQGLFLLDTRSGASTRLTTGVDSAPTWSPEGAAIAFVHQNEFGPEQLTLIDPIAGRRTQVASAFDLAYPTWSVDGARLSFVARTDDTAGRGVFSVKRDGTDLTRLPSPMVSLLAPPVPSRDGTATAFVGRSDGRYGVWVAGPDGADPRPLVLLQPKPPPDAMEVGALAWAPDSSRLLYALNDPGERASEVRRVGRDGTGDGRIVAGPGYASGLNWH